MTKVWAGIIVVFAVALIIVWEQTQSVRLGYRVDNLRVECDRLEQENNDLLARIRALQSMERLDVLARELRLINPDARDIIYLSGNGPQ
jgi:cell division protein FtsL